MTNPIFVDCPAGEWTKVATNIISGQIHRVSLVPYGYLQSYKDTGDAAPTLKSEGVVAFEQSNLESILALSGIDVYLYPLLAAGRVRVDL